MSLADFMIGIAGHMAGMSDQDIATVENSFPAIGKLLATVKKMQPIIDKAMPLINEIEPLVNQAMPLVNQALVEWKAISPAVQVAVNTISRNITRGENTAGAVDDVIGRIKSVF